MEQLSLNIYFREKLFDCITSIPSLSNAFIAVKRNKGAPGIDGVTIEEFEENLAGNLSELSRELREWRYHPHPVKRVRIPKPGTNKKRLLGIPCVRDRVVQYSIKQNLEPLFDPDFSDSSFGFRSGRSQHDAVKKAKELVRSGKKWVVDIDLETFFDTINHDRVIHLLKRKVVDARVLRLVGLTLRSGAMDEGVFVETLEGSVQGSPLSPLLSNIVLHELDQEMERRNLEFCRYADDSNVFASSRKAAERILCSLTHFIESKLKLKVNRDKSKATRCDEVKFLGFTITNDMIAISKKSMEGALKKVGFLIPRGTHLPLEKQIEKVNRWYRGWAEYYALTELPSQMRNIEARIRRRFRLQILRNQKRRKHIVRKLGKQGISRKQAQRAVYQNKGGWALSQTLVVGRAWPNEWFEQRGLFTISNEARPHWQPLEFYVKLA